MRVDLDIPDELGASALDAALEGLVVDSVLDLERGAVSGPGVPTLYTSGVVYERERGTERWLTPSRTFRAGRGDCEDLAAWRAAECRLTGEDPNARARVIRSGPHTWHAIVERADGTIEDPSRILGMGSTTLGSLEDWSLDVRRDGNTWVATLSRGDRGVAGRARYGHDAIAQACRDGMRAGELGFIPGLDILARAAQGALTAAIPGIAPTPSPTGAPTGAPRVTVPRVPTAPTTAPDEPLDAAARRIATQISRLATTEARRKLRDAQRSVQGR